VLQCVAVCCSVLQLVVCHWEVLTSVCMWPCVAVCCSVLQCVAVCCNRWCVMGCAHFGMCDAVCCSVLQCVASCCSVLQCVNTPQHAVIQCATLQHTDCNTRTASRCNTLTATRCNTLQTAGQFLEHHRTCCLACAMSAHFWQERPSCAPLCLF